MKDVLQAREVSIPDSQTTCMMHLNTNTLTTAAVCWWAEKRTWKGRKERSLQREKELEKERKTGRETEGLGSIHVITFPLNSCQGPSAAISLMKCSWCYEQSAWRISSRITTQKPRMLRAQRRCNISTITPRVKTAEHIMSSMFTWHDTWHQSQRVRPRVKVWRKNLHYV